MDKVEKFLRKLSPPLHAKIFNVLERIAAGRLADLDIQPCHGKPHCYRCRVGRIRILFVQTTQGTCIVFDAEFRGNIYKRNR